MTRAEFEESRKKIIRNLMNSVDPEWGCPNEEDIEIVNTCSIALIYLYDKFHSETYLGNVNRYDHNRDKPILVRYEGQGICNFEYSFIIPCMDLEIIRMIADRDKMEYTGVADDVPLVTEIIKRVSDLDGTHLIWG